MSMLFTSKFFSGNRKRLRAMVPRSVPIVMSAHGSLQRSADAAFSFRQDSHFWYLTGVDEPDAILVMDQDTEYLIVSQREGVRAAFDGMVDYDDIRETSGIINIFSPEAGWKKLSERLQGVEQVATTMPPDPYIEYFGMYSNPARARLVTRMREINNALGLMDIRGRLGKMRSIKQPDELSAIRQAIDITVDGIHYITRPERLRDYNYECEAEADLTCYFRKHGATHAFDPIVAGGQNACTLHYLANDDPLRSGELLMFDVGADYVHYAADISRTVSRGKPSARQLAVHGAVCEVQDYALSLLKPGTLITEYERQIEQFMGEKLMELELIKKITSKAVRKYFPHATSHFMGIDPHDAGGYDEPLEPNMVLTCEPGIYIPEEGIGVRIEDDILITKDGNENLSARLPRDLV